MRLPMIAVFFLACSGCADTTAILSFAKMAPDPTAIQSLGNAYAQELDRREEIKLLGDDAPVVDLESKDKLRASQVIGITEIDKAIREYVQALGALASGSIVQSTASVTNVTTGLTAWKTALPAAGITTADVTLIGKLVQSIADLAESGYQNAKLTQIVEKSEVPLQKLVGAQVEIVSMGIRPSIIEIQKSLKDKEELQKYMGDDIEGWKLTAQKDKSALPKTNQSRNIIYTEFGSTDAHVARYLLTRSFEADNTVLQAQANAADAYVKALKAVAAAHTQLYKNRTHLLTKDMVNQIRPLAQESYKALQDLISYESTVSTH